MKNIKVYCLISICSCFEVLYVLASLRVRGGNGVLLSVV
jgi:hypothetical protein